MAIIIKKIYPELLNTQLLVPIPLSEEEFAKRGYNQAKELAKVLSVVLSIPYHEILDKKRTQGITKLFGWHDRLLAVNDLYDAKDIELVTGKKVLLVDDVMTTGLTCSEAGSVLKNSGAESVNVIVARRTV